MKLFDRIFNFSFLILFVALLALNLYHFIKNPNLWSVSGILISVVMLFVVIGDLMKKAKGK